MGRLRGDSYSYPDSKINETSDGQERGKLGPESFRENLPLSPCSARFSHRLFAWFLIVCLAVIFFFLISFTFMIS